MQTIQTIQFYQNTREERLPGFAPEFPYIATRCEIGGDTYRFAPWHWHQAVELFVIQSGTLVYDTPARRLVFPPGSGGFVNSNVLHTTRPQQPGADQDKAGQQDQEQLGDLAGEQKGDLHDKDLRSQKREAPGGRLRRRLRGPA